MTAAIYDLHLMMSSSFFLTDVHLTSDTLLLQYIFNLTVKCWMGFTEQAGLTLSCSRC